MIMASNKVQNILSGGKIFTELSDTQNPHLGKQIITEKSHFVQQNLSPCNFKFTLPHPADSLTKESNIKTEQVRSKPLCVVGVQEDYPVTLQKVKVQKEETDTQTDAENTIESDGRIDTILLSNSETYQIRREGVRMEIVKVLEAYDLNKKKEIYWNSVKTVLSLCKYILQDHNYVAALPQTNAHVQPSLNQHIRLLASSGVQSIISNTVATSVASSSPYSYGNSLLTHNSTIKDDDANSAISSNSDREVDPQGEETETAPEGEGDDDDSITRCICDFQHDDGYMICCDECHVWQHVDCMGIDRNNIPDEYLCESCKPRRVDRHRARNLQMRKREELRNTDSQSDYSTESSTDTDTGMQANVSEARKRNSTIHLKRKSDYNNLRKNSASNTVQQTAPNAVTRQRQRRDSVKEQTAVSSAMQRRSSTNYSKKKEIGSKTLAVENKRLLVKRKMGKAKSQESDNENSEHGSVQQLRQWISHYEEAVTNHYSPELRARIASIRVNGVHSDLKLGSLHGGSVKCRVDQVSPSLKILVSTVALAPNQPVIELRGKYMLSLQQRSSQSTPGIAKKNRPPPGPFLFFYRLPKEGSEVCVDTRTYGNDARFVRRSCSPNAEIRHCIEKGTLHLYIVTISNIDKNCEITIGHDTYLETNVQEFERIVCACGNSKECAIVSSNNGMTENSEKPSEKRERRRRGRRTTSTEDNESLQSQQNTQNSNSNNNNSNNNNNNSTSILNISSGPVRRSSTSIRTPPKQEESCEKISEVVDVTEEKVEKKKLTREERKMEAIMKAFERLEKAEQRRQENQAKQAQKKELDFPRKDVDIKEKEKNDSSASVERPRRRRRKGSRRTSSTSQSSTSQQKQRKRLDSIDSNISSGDEMAENSTVPVEHMSAEHMSPEPALNAGNDPSGNGISTAAGLLLALANAASPPIPAASEGQTYGNSSPQDDVPVSASTTPQQSSAANPNLFSPVCDSGGSGNSQGSTPTNLSSACLLVAAAVGPLAPGFKFPKTKKVLMNEWLSKSPDSQACPLPTPSPPAGTDCSRPLNTQGPGSAKKRWLRQAISEECDSLSPGSPPCPDYVTPLKKRRLARESMSSEQSFTPPSTPTISIDHLSRMMKAEPRHDNPANNLTVSCDDEEMAASIEDVPFVQEEEEEEEFEDDENGVYEVGFHSHQTETNANVCGERDDLVCSIKLANNPDLSAKSDVTDIYCETRNDQLESSDMHSDTSSHNDELNCGTENSDTAAVQGRYHFYKENSCEEEELEIEEDMEINKLSEKEMRSVMSPFKENIISEDYKGESDDCVAMNSYKAAEYDNFARRVVEKETDTPLSSGTVQPAKRKVRTLSISEYRQRKKRNSTESEQLFRMEENVAGSPTCSRNRTDSTSSSSSTSSNDAHSSKILSETPTELSTVPQFLHPEGMDDKKGEELNFMRWNSAPTLVERQRENLTERLRREFGLFLSDDEEQERARKQAILQDSSKEYKRRPLPPPPPPILPPPDMTSHSIVPAHSAMSMYPYNLSMANSPAYGSSSLYSVKGQVFQQKASPSSLYPVGIDATSQKVYTSQNSGSQFGVRANTSTFYQSSKSYYQPPAQH